MIDESSKYKREKDRGTEPRTRGNVKGSTKVLLSRKAWKKGEN
jgi:hypothetical protein